MFDSFLIDGLLVCIIGSLTIVLFAVLSWKVSKLFGLI